MRSSDVLPWVGLALALGSVGCSARPTGVDDGSGTSSTSETAPSSTTEAGSSTTSGSAETTSVGVDSSGSSSDGGIDDGPWPCSVLDPEGWHTLECTPDGGGSSFECDMLAQDCADGEKCMPWANDGGSVWNATRCSPVVPVADPVGEACVVQGSAVSGLDTCALGSVCWSVDPATLEGECVAVCGADDYSCEDPDTTCWVSNDGAIPLCLMVCDPLLQDCADGHACMPTADEESFACVPPGGAALVAAGEPCQYLNACEVGTACVTAQVLPACMGTSCCTPYCDLSMPDCADPTPQCGSWYEEGMSPGAQYEGICVGVNEPPAEGWLDPLLDAVEATLP